MMRGIDISNYQRGLDLAAINCDFAIMKATEGTSITHDTCDAWVQECINLDRCWGFYHFLNAEDPVKQADYFLRECENYFGHGIPVLDYEMYGRTGTANAKRFLDRVYEKTGVRCMVYTSRSVLTEENWSAIAPNHALWVAQYANTDPTGWNDAPWLPDGGFGAWEAVTVHQYTDNGHVSGYSGRLDLDIAYLTPDSWGRIARGDRAAQDENEVGDVDELKRAAREILRTDDPTGRGVNMTTHDHIKWIAAKQADMAARLERIETALSDMGAAMERSAAAVEKASAEIAAAIEREKKVK